MGAMQAEDEIQVRQLVPYGNGTGVATSCNNFTVNKGNVYD